MDIWNNKTNLQHYLKQFSLKTTASAILALNAETVFADSSTDCPFYINNSNYAATICTFQNVTPEKSLTITNNGTVGGILIKTSSQINGVSNSGTINSTSATTNAFQILSSTINGGIFNSGMITSSYTATIITNSSVGGNISNSGTIQGNGYGPAIYLNTVTITGDITNSNSINALGSGAGLIIVSAHVDGGITNSGSITSNQNHGINITGTSSISGNIFNSGTGTISGSLRGINIQAGEIDGGIINYGTIHSDGLGTASSISAIYLAGTVHGGIINSGLIDASGKAILIDNTTLYGGITNSGLINSTNQSGIALLGHIEGDIFNNQSGTINGGAQGIYIQGGGTLNGKIVNDGTIRGEYGILTNGGGLINGGISNNGIIKGDNTGIFISNSTTIQRGISNNGIIKGDNTGIFISSSTIIQGGISNSGTIQGNNYAININPSSSQVDNIDIIGGHARIIGAVVAQNSMVNILNGAIFTSEGDYEVKAFNILQDAIFTMANSITITIDPLIGLNNSGTLALNNLQTLSGNYIQNTGGVFQTRVTSNSDYGQLNVINGTADFSNSGDIFVQVNDYASLRPGDRLSNIIKSNSSTPPTNPTFNVNDNSYFWNFIPEYNNSALSLIVQDNPEAYQVCQGTYCQGAAQVITAQLASGNVTFGPYGALPTAHALQRAISQATPELTNENMQVLQLITRSVMDVVPMWDTVHGKSSGDAMLAQPGKIWVKPYAASMSQNERTTVNGFNATAYGAVVGKDLLFQDGLLGGAFAAGGDTMHGKSVLSGQSINSNAYQGIVYASKKLPHHLYVAGQGLVGYERNNTKRFIPIYQSTAQGGYNSWFTNLRAQAGWSTNLLSPNLVFTPSVDASYLYINQGSYQESGSLMDLSVASNNNSSFVLGAYGNMAYHLMNQQNDLVLTGYAGIAGDVLQNQPQTVATFMAGGPSFSTYGVQFNEVVFRGGVGLAFSKPTSPFLIEINYDLQAGNNAYSGFGAATVKYRT